MEQNVEVMKKKKSPKSKTKANNKSDDSDKRFSPIPRHLSPEEREKWEKELDWERKELERRKREGWQGGRDVRERVKDLDRIWCTDSDIA